MSCLKTLFLNRTKNFFNGKRGMFEYICIMTAKACLREKKILLSSDIINANLHEIVSYIIKDMDGKLSGNKESFACSFKLNSRVNKC